MSDATVTDIYKSVPLGDLFTVIMGCRFAHEIDDAHGIPVIRGRDLALPNPSPEGIQKFVAPKDLPPACFAKKDDILVQRIGDTPRCFLVPDGWQKCLVGDTLLVLRPKNQGVDVESIYHFLSSTAARRVFALLPTGITIRTLTARSLSQSRVPILPPLVGRTVAESQKTEIRIRELADQLRRKREEVFDAVSEDQLRRGIAALQVSQVVVERGLSQVDDLDYRLRNFYPLPLAYPYRLVDAEHEPIRIVKQVYQNAEGLLAFLASLMLALVDRFTGENRKRLLRAWGGKGATFNNWLSVADCTGRLVGRDRGLIHASLHGLLGDRMQPTAFAEAITWLVDRRDDFHDRDWPVGDETDRLIAQLKERMARCFAEIGFLLQAEFLLVLDFDADRDSDALNAKCLVYAGDHPGCRRTERLIRARLKKQDLYLALDADTWVSLYPYISVHYCHHCKARETYYVDKWNRGEPAALKSFERWHGEESPEISLALERALSGE